MDHMSWYGFLLAKYWSMTEIEKAKLIMQDMNGTMVKFIFSPLFNSM
jgi:hypothetical protein